jgi:hypothetical protein
MNEPKTVRDRPILWSSIVLLAFAWTASPARAALVEWAKPDASTSTVISLTSDDKGRGGGGGGTTITPGVKSSPEPATVLSALSGVGLLGFATWLRRRRRDQILPVEEIEEEPTETDEEPFSA